MKSIILMKNKMHISLNEGKLTNNNIKKEVQIMGSITLKILRIVRGHTPLVGLEYQEYLESLMVIYSEVL